MPPPSIYAIPEEKPFVDVLARGVLARYGENPLELSRVLILLPSRRACRSLREAFLRATGGKPLLLPRLQPIGDVEEDELWLGEAEFDVLPAIPSLQRLLLLTRQVAALHRTQHRQESNIEQSARLAIDLARFVDEVTREGVSFDRLAELVPDDFAAHWQVTLEFLTIISHHWPQILAERGMLEPVTRRQRLMQSLAKRWQATPPAYPVIAAGTTGSIPATAQLLRVVAHLPQGMVILPGLDRQMTRVQWEHVDETHPQYGLKLLLEQLHCEPEGVAVFDDAEIAGAPPERLTLFNEALRPASLTDGWRQSHIDSTQALAGVTYVSAASLQEEARAIALMLREALATPGKTAALVTPDRNLARRVASVLQRFDISIDDSAGRPLADTPPATYLRLLADMASSQAAPVALLALMKHPFAGGGMATAAFRDAIRSIELLALRGVRLASGFAAIRQTAVESKDATRCLNEIEKRCQPLLAMMSRRAVPLKELIATHLSCAEALADTANEKGAKRLWARKEGEQLAAFLSELQNAAGLIETVDPASYPGLFHTLLSGQSFRPAHGTHQRLHILSPMEARLQHFDRVILGGMNEECWPAAALADPWMSRPMRAKFGLPSPERRIGMEAHDLMMLVGAKEVFFTRSEKVGGTPTVPSRWLLRLQALLKGTAGNQSLFQADKRWIHWAEALDRPCDLTPIAPPAPKPPLSMRPRRLSVTQVETLQRDPYAVYAKHILKLKVLDPLDQEPDVAEFGTLVHRALEEFVRSHPANLPENAHELLIATAREQFVHVIERPAIATFWWPRFERIASWFIERERERRMQGVSLLAESQGTWQFSTSGGDFTLKAVMDRIEVGLHGVTIVDYKTGAIPDVRSVQRGLACQLPLEAVIAEKGSIAGLLPGKKVAELEYWKLSGGEAGGEIKSISGMNVNKQPLDVRALIDQAEEGLRRLIAAFDNPAYPYHSCPVPDWIPRYNDYEHFARVKEWSVG